MQKLSRGQEPRRSFHARESVSARASLPFYSRKEVVAAAAVIAARPHTALLKSGVQSRKDRDHYDRALQRLKRDTESTKFSAMTAGENMFETLEDAFEKSKLPLDSGWPVLMYGTTGEFDECKRLP